MNNFCVKCKVEIPSNRKYCKKCSRYSAQEKINKVSKGICAGCSNPVKTKYYCESCLQKRSNWEKERRKRYLSSNCCAKCGDDNKLKEITLCFDCWLKSKASVFLGKKTDYVLLKNIWDSQNGLCAISGRKLIPGINASIDHIIPKSKGGTNSIDNLQWVLIDINAFKHNDKDLKDLVKLCKDIIEYQLTK